MRSLPGGTAVTSLDRRQLIAAAGSGALLGSAWAALFRNVTRADDVPTVTTVWSPAAFALLIAYRGHRLLVLDASDNAGAAAAIELVTGVMHQRIDVILAPSATLPLVTRHLRNRWGIRATWSINDQANLTGHDLAGRVIRIDEVNIHASPLPQGAWREDQSGPAMPWYLTAAFAGTSAIIASDATALDRLPLDSAHVNAVICPDRDLQLPVQRSPIGVLVVPAGLQEEIDAGDRRRAMVPLHVDVPVTLRLQRDGIGLPPTV